MDAAALKLAKAGRYESKQGAKGTHCFRFRMKFELRE
jgi:hypothetical protein